MFGYKGYHLHHPWSSTPHPTPGPNFEWQWMADFLFEDDRLCDLFQKGASKRHAYKAFVSNFEPNLTQTKRGVCVFVSVSVTVHT